MGSALKFIIGTSIGLIYFMIFMNINSHQTIKPAGALIYGYPVILLIAVALLIVIELLFKTKSAEKFFQNKWLVLISLAVGAVLMFLPLDRLNDLVYIIAVVLSGYYSMVVYLLTK